MRHLCKSPSFLSAMALGTAMLSPAARADINGFGDFSQYQINIDQNDVGAAPTIPTPGTIELTNGGGETRSIFATTPQNVSQFIASFTYKATNGGYDGAAFVIENDPSGDAALGLGGSAAYQGITKSIAVLLDLNGSNTGLFTNGNIGGGEQSTSPVNLNSGDPINVQLKCSGSTLTETLFDTVTSASFSTSDLLLTSIPTTVGSSTAYVGMTAGTYPGYANQFFSNFQFSSSVTPEPCSAALLATAALWGLGTRRRRSV